ncbi:CoA-transferase [Terrilactibacillus sp. S3-3]|nr:CoA-transferase [Terrilactibacillus sp. S3-3]
MKRNFEEYWTNLTIPERFMAAANGWDFAPTCSLRGSTLLEDHLKSGKALLFRDPVSNKEMIFIRSLQPDVAIIHGSVADAAGNTVITPPYGEDLWGVLAAKKVVVIVEKVVDQATIRTLSHLVKIPSHKVDYVVEVPFGAHPYGTSPIGYSKQAYGEDYEFRKEFSQAVRDEGISIRS